MLKEFQGICPRCRLNTGPVGQACPNPDCIQHEYSYIPLLAYDAAVANAERKGGKIDPWLGRRFDRYLLTGKAGEGGMGTVYIALQAPLNREVALKVMISLSVSREALERFEIEAKALSALDHPNILKLFDYGFGNLDGKTIPYMVLEYVKHGRTLKKLLQADIQTVGTMRPETILPIFDQILCGLAAAHSAGITHRDVKPENVMLTQIHGNQNFAKILDFGLATGLRGYQAGQTGPNELLGTPNYMAPEQIPGARKSVIDHRADLYATGVMLFEAMTGARPFPGDTALAVLTAKSNEMFNPFDIAAACRLTRPQRMFLEKAIAFDADLRFQDASEMLEALRQAMVEPAPRKSHGLLGLVQSRLRRSATPGTAADTTSNTGSSSSGATPSPTPGPFSTPTPTPFSNATPTPTPDRGFAGLRPAPDFKTNPPTQVAAGGDDLEVDIQENQFAPQVNPGSRPITGQTRPLNRSITGQLHPQTRTITGQSRPLNRPVTGQLQTMTPEERAERLKNRKRRTTGRNYMSATRVAEIESMKKKPGKASAAGISIAAVALILMVLAIALFFIIPRIQERQRYSQLKEDLAILSEPLTDNGRFVGLDSPFLMPGTQTDHFVADALNPGRPARDPWGNPYRVKYSMQNPAGYVLFSTGPDGQKGDCSGGGDSDDVCVILGSP